MDALRERYKAMRDAENDPHVALRRAQQAYGTPAAMCRELTVCVDRWASGLIEATPSGLRLLKRELDTLAYWCSVDGVR